MNGKVTKTEQMVSVIITTYGQSVYLKRAVQSVLDQTYPLIEVLVIDDNGLGTAQQKCNESVVRSIPDKRVQYISHEHNLNGSAARNTGIQAAKGGYIAFLDDDDFYFPERLCKLVDAVENADATCQGAYSDVLIQESGMLLSVTGAGKDGDLLEDLLMNRALIGTGSNLFFTRKVVQQIGMFDVSFKRYQDVEYLMRFFHAFTIAAVHEPLVVKDCAGRNYPDLNAHYRYFDHFTKTFIDDVHNLSKEKQDQYYLNAYLPGLVMAVKGGDAQELRMAIKRIETIRPLLPIEQRMVKRARLTATIEQCKRIMRSTKFTSWLYGMIQRMSRRKKHQQIISSLKDAYILK